MELWENVILTGYLLWGSWYDIRKSGSGGGIVPGRSTGCYGYCLERL